MKSFRDSLRAPLRLFSRARVLGVCLILGLLAGVCLALGLLDGAGEGEEAAATWTTPMALLNPVLCNENGVYVGRKPMNRSKAIEDVLDRLFPEEKKTDHNDLPVFPTKIAGDLKGLFRVVKYIDINNNAIHSLYFSDGLLRVVMWEKPFSSEKDNQYTLEHIFPIMQDHFQWTATIPTKMKTAEYEEGAEHYVEAIRPVTFYQYSLKSDNRISLWLFNANLSAFYIVAENADVLKLLLRTLNVEVGITEHRAAEDLVLTDSTPSNEDTERKITE